MATGFINAYAAGTIDAKRRGAFDRHIASCVPCTKFLGTYRDAIRITNALACHDLPSELSRRIETFLAKG